ncbi:hypothetical protein ACQ4PT_069717 [Festuca glaucescens]
MAHGLEMAGSGQDHQASGAPAVEPRDDRGGSTGEPRGEGGSREILSEEEEDSPRAPAPPTDGLLAHERQQTDEDRKSNDGLSRSVNLRNVISENNWVMLMCASSHPKCAKWVHSALFLGGIVLAMSSRDMEVSAFSETERIHGCEHDQYCLSAESALRVSLPFFLFFTFMFTATVWTKKVHERRKFWNSNLGVLLLIKITLVIGFLYLVQVLPSPFIQFYGKTSIA